LSGPVNLPEETEAVAVKEGGADKGVHQVIGKSHAAHGGQTPGDKGQFSRFVDQHQTPNVRPGKEKTAPIIELLPLEHGVLKGPIVPEISEPPGNDHG